MTDGTFGGSVNEGGGERHARRAAMAQLNTIEGASIETRQYLPSSLPPHAATSAPPAAFVAPQDAYPSAPPQSPVQYLPPKIAYEPIPTQEPVQYPPQQLDDTPEVPQGSYDTSPPAAYLAPQMAYQQSEPQPPVQPIPSPVIFESQPQPGVFHPVSAQELFSPAAGQPARSDVAPSVPPEFEMQRDPTLNADSDLDAALQQVLLLGASDLHIAVNSPPMIRIDGELRALTNAPAWNQEKVTLSLRSILTPLQLERFESELEFDFAYTLSASARFRVNFYQQRDNIGAAFRLIPTKIMSLSELGIPDTIARFAQLARGLVLVTGPTGSGKSTTLAGLIDLVNRTRADHIVTVEDPIEFLHGNRKSLINQREVGHDTHSFGAALKHVLRQDPDVILVGELRDLETISVALTAAETGHLVFATLHTSDASQTIDRIIDVYPPHQQSQVRAQLAATLQGVVCQTLIKKAGGKGRVVATEVLIRTNAIANLIREGKTFQIPSAMQVGRELGMHTMDQHLADLVSTGQITLDAAKEKTHDLEVLNRLISGSRAPTAPHNMADALNYRGQN
jgi:twitching motility protein PilT